MLWLSDSENVSEDTVTHLIQHTNVTGSKTARRTDRHRTTDGQTPHDGIQSRGKNDRLLLTVQ